MIENITFSQYENEPDITVTSILPVKGFINKIKMMYNILISDKIEVSSVFDFQDQEGVKSAIAILSEMIEEEKVFINVKKVLPEAILPTRAHDSDVGWDLYSPIDFRLNPGEMRRIDFGIIVDIPKDYYIQVHNRSGVVWKYNTMMALGVGVCDPLYRGTILAPFYNFGTEQVMFSRGDRIAQMVVRKVENVRLVEGEVDINIGDRKDGGYGSSGK